jgi:dynein heavy chain
MSESLPDFKGIDEDIIKNLDEWEKIYNSSKPHKPNKLPWPGSWGDLTDFKKLLVLRALRPDKIVPGI